MDVRKGYVIDAENADKIRNWVTNRGGCLVWYNLEIGSSQPINVMTPAKTEEGADYPAPNWRYGQPELLDPCTAIVRTFTPVAGFRGRAKLFFWGYGLAPTTEAKAKRLTAKYNEQGRHCGAEPRVYEYQYTFDEPGYAKIEIGVVGKEPLLKEAVV